MAVSDKDTIYIDIDDEITSIIDKVRTSKGKVIALVLPKRATVFQSIVNMRLLKRATDDAKKNLVLITSEAGLLPLAGAAGVHVAKTLNTKPEIPAAPGQPVDEDSIDEDGEELVELPPEAADKPVGELAAAAGASKLNNDDVETVTLDDDDEDSAVPAAAGAAAAGKATKGKKPKKDKKLAIPNFERFRLLLVLGVIVLVLLIGGLVSAFTIMPKATISVKTDATSVNSDLTLNLSTTATTVKASNNTLPAKLASQQKTFTQQATATGQKNTGNKASGSVTVTNCSDGDVAIPGGTGFSANGNTYISQSTVNIPGSNFNSSGKCKNDGKNEVNVLAQNGGAAFNIPAGANFSIANNPGKLTASGNTMSGGTDNITQVVTQTDIESAKSKIAASSDNTMKQTLQSQLKTDGYYAITTTFTTGTPALTTSAKAGDAATTVTATETVAYSMFGVHENDLKTVVETDIKKQIDTSKQSILDNGISSATFAVNSATAAGAQVAMSATASAGPDLSIEDIKQQAAGKKPADVRSALTSNPDVTDVDVKLSPFFVSSVPKKLDKIKVDIAKPSATKSSSNDDN